MLHWVQQGRCVGAEVRGLRWSQFRDILMSFPLLALSQVPLQWPLTMFAAPR